MESPPRCRRVRSWRQKDYTTETGASGWRQRRAALPFPRRSELPPSFRDPRRASASPLTRSADKLDAVDVLDALTDDARLDALDDVAGSRIPAPKPSCGLSDIRLGERPLAPDFAR